MRRRWRSIAALVLAMVMCFGFAAECRATTYVTDLRNYRIDSSGVSWSRYRTIAQRLKLRSWKTVYFDKAYRNKTIRIGFARNARYGGTKRYYSFALNRGSKKFRFYGVTIGDTLATVKRKLSGTKYNYNIQHSSKYWGYGDYDMFVTSFSGGRLASWKYYCAPTS